MSGRLRKKLLGMDGYHLKRPFLNEPEFNSQQIWIIRYKLTIYHIELTDFDGHSLILGLFPFLGQTDISSNAFFMIPCRQKCHYEDQVSVERSLQLYVWFEICLKNLFLKQKQFLQIFFWNVPDRSKIILRFTL